MMIELRTSHLGNIITAIGGLGTAAFGIVDASKGIFRCVNRIGLRHIKKVVSSLVPDQSGSGLSNSPMNALPRKHILDTIEAHWVNGTELATQKTVAKSLIKLHLSTGNAEIVAVKTNVDPVVLHSVAQKIVAGISLTQPENDVYSRFDLIVTAQLDEAYEISDQVYRNRTRLMASAVAILLAVLGVWILADRDFCWWKDLPLALLVGLLATPLAPIAKDLSSGLASAVNTMQQLKKK